MPRPKMTSGFPERAPNKRCPRCHWWYPPNYFPDPVTICFACYSTCPGNEGLNFPELAAKAMLSHCAPRNQVQRDRINKYAQARPFLKDGMTIQPSRLGRMMQGRHAPEPAIGMHECSYCRQLVAKLYTYTSPLFIDLAPGPDYWPEETKPSAGRCCRGITSRIVHLFNETNQPIETEFIPDEEDRTLTVDEMLHPERRRPKPGESTDETD